jgi:hypothetical protein
MPKHFRDEFDMNTFASRFVAAVWRMSWNRIAGSPAVLNTAASGPDPCLARRSVTNAYCPWALVT